jgi:hypothetical protein
MPPSTVVSAILALAVLSLPSVPALPPSDHGDTPILQTLSRPDANITDLHLFVRNGNLVVAVSMNPAIPPGVSTYVFPSDLEVEIFVDNDSAVSFEDPLATATFGGTVLDPDGIHPDRTFVVRFEEDGSAVLDASGLSGPLQPQVQFFAGLRDDPFIRGPRQGRNVAALVLSVPLSAVLEDQETVLVWAISRIPGVDGPSVDHGGRALRSMLPENNALNFLEPDRHFRDLGLLPDVVVLDTSRPVAFPNGRELADDVVDLVGDPRVLVNDAPFPTANDVPFLATFPFLSPPHP